MEDQLLDSIDDQGFKNVSYAGFWERFVAALIDGLILFVVTFALGLVLKSEYLKLGVNVIIQLLYFTYFESSLKQATIGKQLMNMKVVDKNGGRLTPATALIRYLSKFISGIILLIGYIMAAFDARKQSLHDKIAGTFVVKV
ncbi:MAG: RDD family protein [Bacteroidetes bacterium]|jgi:uncharacterized RDD family membrane protein YckC|nr:RDD family protein [Bacteroidota bacterium]MBL0078409.1 RDD family protein [Bacteroidota bacterium]